MISWVLRKIIGSRNERLVNKLRVFVNEINDIEKNLQSLSDEHLQSKTDEFRKRLAAGETLDDIMCEAFAVVKNACRRMVGKSWQVCNHDITWNMIPFDVQLIGAIVLHRGAIAEMATGEGKTLVATMPVYLNALTGKGVHLVTVNDYLAKRDSQWMGEIFRFLGLTVGCIQHDMDRRERRQQYMCDITYGTNSEFGFDYLRDNGALDLEEQSQRGHNYAIIDEVDSILIDEARTPLIISGPVSVSTHKYDKLKPLVENLVRKQQTLCSKLLSDAKEIIDNSGDMEDAGIKLFQVSRGTPKNKQLHKLLEEPKMRRLFDKTELEMMSDARKEESHELLETLFFIIDEKNHSVDLSEKGRETLSPTHPEEYILPDIITSTQQIDEDESLNDDDKNIQKRILHKTYEESNQKIHNLSQLLRAYSLFEKDVDYVVQDNRVMIVDEYTGRLMPGRRFSEGLHQALEAKEGVTIERETQTFATITIQNYFRLYNKLSGMTGTAETEAEEFSQIYKLDVVVIPTNEQVRRLDMDDVIYKTKREKFNAIINEIVDAYQDGQPVLVGTISVETSELLSRMLRMKKIPHQVLNAKYHEKEAEIVANAGQSSAVTIATNMAGRGTDIKLGAGVIKEDPRAKNNGDFVIKKSLGDAFRKRYGGLHIIGTERHESRRIDRQLRGRAGRQGDPGSSKFFISLEDDLMRLFGSDRIAGIMEKIGIEEGQELVHPLLTRQIETAQKRVEQRNFSMRKRILEYDDVMNKQREVIYGYRNQILRGEGISEMITGMAEEEISNRLSSCFQTRGEVDPSVFKTFEMWYRETFLIPIDMRQLKSQNSLEGMVSVAVEWMHRAYSAKERLETPEKMRHIEKMVALQTIDRLWIEHLYNMDNLRQDIGYRSYGQRDPLIEYKQESYELFSELIDTIRKEIIDYVFKISLIPPDRQRNILAGLEEQFASTPVSSFQPAGVPASSQPMPSSDMDGAMQMPMPARRRPVKRSMPKVGRNDLCPCGSGKKFKKCCGQ